MEELLKFVFELIGSLVEANETRERLAQRAPGPAMRTHAIVRSRKKKPLRRGLARRTRRPSKHGSRVTWT